MDADAPLAVEIRGLGRSRRLEVAPGTAILEALLTAGLPAPHRCRQALCGRCRVFVAAGAKALEPPGVSERVRLGPMLAMGMRLMCQARPAPAACRQGVGLVIDY